MKKQEQCPTEDLLKYFNAVKADSSVALPTSIAEHAKNCEACASLLAMPSVWEAYLEASKSTATRTFVETFSSSDIKEGCVCRVKASDGINSSIALVTAIIKNKDFIRVSPIAVSPFEKEVDKETDILVSPEDMPNGLPSLIEWWNDRPVMIKSVDLLMGKVSNKVLKSVKESIRKQETPSKLTRALFTFREIEKNKGNQLSAAFFEKYLVSEAEEIRKPAKKNIIQFVKITIEELFGANEELAMAAATFPIDKLKKLLQANDKNYSLRQIKGKPGITIYRADNKPFELVIYTKQTTKQLYESDEDGQLYLEKGFPVDKKSFKSLILQIKNE